MSGLVVFLVLLFSLIVAGREDDDTNALDPAEDNDSEEPCTDCCHEEECCQEEDCCQKVKSCCHKVKDCCPKIQERCQGKTCWKNHWQQLCASVSSAAVTRTTVTTSISSSSTPGSTSSASTDSTLSSHQTPTPTWTASSPTSSSQSSTSTEPVPSSTARAANGSSVTVPVLICLAVLFVVVVVVAVFFLWRRKRHADVVRKENKSCLSAAINFERSQDSQENRRTNIDNASTTAANSPDNDNNDDYTYIDDTAINKGVVRLHEDRPVTTDGQHALTDPSVSGLEPDLSSTYTLARPIDNDIPDPQPPDYFILEKDPAPDAESTQYFTLEERSEKDSAVDTDTQQYFILEDRRQGGDKTFVPEVMSSESGADYFVLEKDDNQESDCVARDDSSRCPLEDAEYSRLDPNRQESDYTALNHTA